MLRRSPRLPIFRKYHTTSSHVTIGPTVEFVTGPTLHVREECVAFQLLDNILNFFIFIIIILIYFEWINYSRDPECCYLLYSTCVLVQAPFSFPEIELLEVHSA